MDTSSTANDRRDGVEPLSAGGGGAPGLSEDDEDYQQEPDFVELDNEQVLHQLQQNGSSLVSLGVGVSGDGLSGIDWKAEGQSITSSTNLKTMVVGQYSSRMTNVNDMYEGIATNRSIEHLVVSRFDGYNSNGIPTFRDTGATLAFLYPFLTSNNRLRRLDISECACMWDDECTLLFARAFGERTDKSSLRAIRLDGLDLSDESAAKIVAGLEGYHNLTNLSFSGNQIGTKTCMALQTILEDAKYSLRTLELYCTDLHEDESLFILTKSIIKGKKLKVLHLGMNDDITPVAWVRFTLCLHDDNSALEVLKMERNGIGRGDQVPGRVCGDQQVAKALGVALTDNKTLKHLDLESNHINGVGLKALVRALASNRTLETLNLGSNQGISAAAGDWSDLANTLCNTESILATFESNHTLRGLGDRIEVPSDLVSSLQLNRHQNKFEVARNKIIQHHLMAGGKANVQAFVAMDDVKVLTHAIAWLGRDNSGKTIVYSLIRSIPSLFAHRGVDPVANSVSEADLRPAEGSPQNGFLKYLCCWRGRD